MDDRLIELYIERGRLRERIGAQRGQLAQELAPISTALHSVDRTRVKLRETRAWLYNHPATVAVAVVVLVVLRPATVVRSLRWGFTFWRKWTRWRVWIQAGARAF
jgi:hypothetical protein